MDKTTKEKYQKAKVKCRLDEREVEMAAAIGLSPEKLLAMIPNPKERWKDPVALRIRRIYDRFLNDNPPD